MIWYQKIDRRCLFQTWVSTKVTVKSNKTIWSKINMSFSKRRICVSFIWMDCYVVEMKMHAGKLVFISVFTLIRDTLLLTIGVYPFYTHTHTKNENNFKKIMMYEDLSPFSVFSLIFNLLTIIIWRSFFFSFFYRGKCRKESSNFKYIKEITNLNTPFNHRANSKKKKKENKLWIENNKKKCRRPE